MKVVYFDVESYEEKFLCKHSNFQHFQETASLNPMSEIDSKYLDANIISVFTTSRLNREVLEQFKSLKLIALRSVGYNHVDLDYCKERGICVVNSPNYGNITVAEFALALMLDVCRKVTPSYLDYKNARVFAKNLIGCELFGKTVGIVGLGAIGSEFARITHGLNMKILGYDKFEKDELKQKYNVQYTDFDTLLKYSDFISIHAPLTEENYHLFNENSFKKMKSNAIIINTGRGEIIDTDALYKSLLCKKIAGAGLDVLENEEAFADIDYIVGINRLDSATLRKTILNTRLFQLNNIIITPHIAYNTQEAIFRILHTTVDNITSFIKGEIKNQVRC